MIGVELPIGQILLGDLPIANHQQILGIRLFRSRREVEGAGDDHLAVEDHDLVVGDGVFRVDSRGHAAIVQEVGHGILPGFLAVVEDDVDLDSSLVRTEQGLAIGDEVNE